MAPLESVASKVLINTALNSRPIKLKELYAYMHIIAYNLMIMGMGT